jgi:NitT/TauT family transport system ATP-binding protein
MDKRPDELSGGMRQRVAVARALAMRRKVLLMDEPFAALDVKTRAKMQDFLLDVWQDSGASALFVTHHIEEAIALADCADTAQVFAWQRQAVPGPRCPVSDLVC